MENTRRDFIKTSVLAAGALTFGLPGNANVPSEYPYVLSDLPYAFNALEPYIDAMTMEIHHDKHHKAYTDKFNAALEKFARERYKMKKDGEDLYLIVEDSLSKK